MQSTAHLDKAGAKEKYGMDAPFEDPIIRCDGCKKMIRLDQFGQVGRCQHCGSNRIRNLQTMSQEEHDQAIAWNIDPAFLALWEGQELCA